MDSSIQLTDGFDDPYSHYITSWNIQILTIVIGGENKKRLAAPFEE